MDINGLKKFLAGIGIASLIAGSTLTLSGCPKKPGASA